MGMEIMPKIGGAPVFSSALRFTGNRSGQMSEKDIDAEMEKQLEQQKKAEEELKRRQQLKDEQKQKEQELDMLEKQLEASKKEAESMEDMYKAFAKCLKIASRISRGDIVPAKDMKYLAEHEPDLYKQAILLRMPNPKPKKHKSLVDDEDEKTSETQGGDASAESSGDGSEAVMEAAPAEETGSETKSE
ncbi:MAG: hypothetical protein J6O50_00215 [Ruminiclostridium sp.]|nr:hypothetical protein [Ruminiclostridium sp.]